MRVGAANMKAEKTFLIVFCHRWIVPISAGAPNNPLVTKDYFYWRGVGYGL